MDSVGWNRICFIIVIYWLDRQCLRAIHSVNSLLLWALLYFCCSLLKLESYFNGVCRGCYFSETSKRLSNYLLLPIAGCKQDEKIIFCPKAFLYVSQGIRNFNLTKIDSLINLSLSNIGWRGSLIHLTWNLLTFL